jgi:hypothetical protein
MAADLVAELKAKLLPLSRGEIKALTAGKVDPSFSMLYQIKLGSYRSDIRYGTLQKALTLLSKRRKK